LEWGIAEEDKTSVKESLRKLPGTYRVYFCRSKSCHSLVNQKGTW
jgi:hypothetical protein